MLPAQGSHFAGEVDFIYMGLFWLSVVLFLGITGVAVWCCIRFRYKPGRATPHMTHNTTIEIVWSVLPLLLCIAIFFWGVDGFMKFSVAPGDALEIQVTAKKWLWQFEYPDGSRTINDLHIPVNKPVRFVMTSEDVLHDFFVPTMRVKNDIIPSRYTEVWFTPTVLGAHHVTCAEYCGKGHSDMQAKLTVETDAEFKKFLETGGTEWEDYRGKPADWGKLQWDRKGCSTCHSLDGKRGQGPSWKGIWGKKEKMADGSEVLVDENYVRESMMLPQAKVTAGFDPIMPTFQGLLREHEIQGIIAFIKSLGDNPTGGPPAPTTLSLPAPDSAPAKQ
jgi:cytochrome c oxidase subunit 2